MAAFDRKKPYGEVCGADPEGRRYEQGGVFFNAAGEEVREKGKAKPPASVIVEMPDAEFDGMDADALHELAKKLGVQVHHNAGADKVRAALLAARDAKDEGVDPQLNVQLNG